MMYRCRACDEEVERGWLPSATCGLYLFSLLVCALFVLTVFLAPALPVPGASPLPDAPRPSPWWVGPLVIGGGLLAGAVLVYLMDVTLSLGEYLVVRRKPCPKCGAKRWSLGYTRGMGL
jgi:hypothetical protein